LSLLLGWGAAWAAPAKEEFDFSEALTDADLQEIQKAAEQVLPELARLGDAREWNAFWSQVESVLQGQSLEDLGWLMGSVDVAYEYVNSVPEARTLADWLKQRLDYFDLAGAVIQQMPETGAATSPPPPKVEFQLPTPLRKLTVLPRRLGPAAGMIEARRWAAVRNPENWKIKLRGRPLPKDAPRLVPQLKKVFDAEGTPARWVWVAEVESSLNPEARSPAGAVGLFQLMPETAKRFGLRVFPFDERVKPERSAKAAAQYLKLLHQQFGSWSLALAAYNAGEGRVSRALKKNGGKTFEEVAKHLPLETQMYVPKVMATAALREDQANGVPYSCWLP
jgi:membrane-bound lytic murein transglycosylase D